MIINGMNLATLKRPGTSSYHQSGENQKIMIAISITDSKRNCRRNSYFYGPYLEYQSASC